MRLDKSSHKALLIMNIVLSVLCLMLVAFCVVHFGAGAKAGGSNIAIKSIYLNVEHPEAGRRPAGPTVIYLGDADATKDKETERENEEEEQSETEVITENVILQGFPISKTVRLVMVGDTGKKGELTIAADGSFKGLQKGSTSVNGETVSTAALFNGSFSNIRQISEHTYAAELMEVNYENKRDKFWVENGEKYLFAEVGGLKVGEEFLLYVPGAQKEELPESYRALYADWKPETALETFALHCPETKLGYMEQK